MRGADLVHWLGFGLGYRYAPKVLLKWFWQHEPQGRLDLPIEERLQLMLSRSKSLTNEKDLEVMKDEDFLRMGLRSTEECFKLGFDAVAQDGKLMSSPWGFRIEDTRSDLPVKLWYGKQDSFVPLNHGEQIAVRLGGRAHLRVEDETHGSLQVKYKAEIFEELVKHL
jgi:hypothetical protein